MVDTCTDDDMYYERKYESEVAYDFYLKANAVSVICIEAYMHTQNLQKDQFAHANCLCEGILFSRCLCVCACVCAYVCLSVPP